MKLLPRKEMIKVAAVLITRAADKGVTHVLLHGAEAPWVQQGSPDSWKKGNLHRMGWHLQEPMPCSSPCSSWNLVSPPLPLAFSSFAPSFCCSTPLPLLSLLLVAAGHSGSMSGWRVGWGRAGKYVLFTGPFLFWKSDRYWTLTVFIHSRKHSKLCLYALVCKWTGSSLQSSSSSLILCSRGCKDRGWGLCP